MESPLNPHRATTEARQAPLRRTGRFLSLPSKPHRSNNWILLLFSHLLALQLILSLASDSSSSSSILVNGQSRSTVVNSQQSTSTLVQPRFIFLTPSQRKARANANHNSNSTSSSSINIRNKNSGLIAAATTTVAAASTIANSLRPVRVTYTDIEKTNKTCLPKDTCASSRNDRNGAMMNDPKRRNCFCDQQCIVYEDCCVDSAYRRDPNVTYKKNEIFQCVTLRQFGSLYMKTRCPNSWKDDTVRKGCEEDRTSAYDPISTLPITNMKSGFTFKNYFCALCNNQTFNDRMEVWKPRIECPSLSTKELENITQAEILNRLEYRQEEGRWGITVKRGGSSNNNNGGAGSRRGNNNNNDGGESIWNGCGIDPVVPINVEHLVRFCKPSIKDCPENYNNTEVHRKCLSYTATVYHLQEGYRNVHCAICNGILAENLFCSPHGTSRSAFHFEFNQAAFSLLFDLNPESGNEVGKIRKCTKDEIYDPFFQKCRSILCQSGQYYKNGHCYRAISRGGSGSTTTSTTSTRKTTTSTRRPTYDITIINGNDETTIINHVDTNSLEDSPTSSLAASRRKALEQQQAEIEYYESCPKIQLDGNEYEILDNGSVYIVEYKQILSKRNYAISGNDQIIICAPKEAKYYYIEKFGPIWGYLTFTCVLISVISLLVHLIITAILPEMRNLSGKNIASLSVAFLIIYSIFLGMPFVQIPSSSCTAMAVILYYSFISAFCWMLILGWDVSSTLRRATVELRVSSGSQWTRFICYSTFGWLFPALMTIITIAAEYLPEYMKFPYSPRFGEQNCWFGQKPALLIYFIGPVGFILLLNTILFIDAARLIASTTHGTSKAKVCGPSHKNFKLYLRLGLLMGISWILGIVAGFADKDWVWLLFILFNTLQGLFILIGFTCTSKVRKGLSTKLCCFSSAQPNASWTWSGIVGAGVGGGGDRNNMIRTVSDSSSNNTKRSDLISDPVMIDSRESYSHLHHHHNEGRHTPSPIYNIHHHGGGGGGVGGGQQPPSMNSVRLGGKQIGGINNPRVSSPIYRSSTTEMYIS